MPDTMISESQPAPAAAYLNRSPEIKDLAAALVKAQAALSGAKKEAKAIITGQQTRTYADLASVWEAIREPLTANDLCIVQFPRTAGNGVEIETTLMHGKTGQFMRDILWVPCGKTDAQGLGSAITYGRRYALMAVVGVCPVDDDGAAAVESTPKGVPGSAGAGGQFRPERRAGSMAPAKGETNAQNGTALPDAAPKPNVGRAATAEQARAAKIKAATDKRIKALKDGPWTPDTLKQFWDGDVEWRAWMSDAANEALADWERYTTAYDDARDLAREAA